MAARRRGAIAHPLSYAVHEDFVLLFAQFKKDFLSFDEVCHAFASHFAENGGGRMMGIGQLLADSMHDIRILPHRKVQHDPLRGKESLDTLLSPTR